MSKVLYIKANAKSEGESRTFKIADSFMKVYKAENPDDEIIELDLYEIGVPFLPKGEFADMQKAVQQNDKNHPVLKFAYQFIEADKYIIAEPIWNLGIPAILKAYIDCVVVAGITFNYTEKGPVGTCENKKAVNIITRGGDYSSEFMDSLEMADKYLRNIFGFLGITDYTSVSANCLDVGTADSDKLLKDAIAEAEKLAASF